MWPHPFCSTLQGDSRHSPVVYHLRSGAGAPGAHKPQRSCIWGTQGGGLHGFSPPWELKSEVQVESHTVGALAGDGGAHRAPWARRDGGGSAPVSQQSLPFPPWLGPGLCYLTSWLWAASHRKELPLPHMM